ncbi:MAG: hypothetical protein FJX72_14900, partial [Armatimonadetes bacterium]|nr:hypothetical protein [Armatimonadota bacterium]
MKATTTFSKLFATVQTIEGKRLALLRAADFLEWEAAATDLGPATKPLRSRALWNTDIPDDVVLDAIADMRLQARELEAERERLLNATVTIDKRYLVRAEAESDLMNDIAGRPQMRVVG